MAVLFTVLAVAAVSGLAATGFQAEAQVQEPVSRLIVSEASIVWDDDDAPRLWQPTGVETFERHGRVYAAIITEAEDALQLVDITDPDNPRATDAIDTYDRNRYFLDPHDVTIYERDGKTYAVIVSHQDAVQVIDVSDPGDLQITSHVRDESGVYLGNGHAVDIFERQGAVYAVVASESENGIQLVTLSNPEELRLAGGLGDNSQRLLDDARGVAVFARGNTNFAVVTSETEDGIQIVSLSDPNGLRAVGRLAADADLDYDNPRDVVVFELGTNDYAAVASTKGLRIIDISDTDRPVNAGQWVDGSFSQDTRPNDMDVFSMEGRTFVAMTFDGSGGVSFVDVTDPHAPVHVGSLKDSTSRALDTVYDIDIFTRGDSTYAAAVSWEEDAMQILRLAIEEDTKPELASASLDERSGVLTIRFTEPVDVSKTNMLHLHVSSVGASSQVPLHGADYDRAGSDADILRFKLSESQRRIIDPMDTPQLDITEGAVRDRAGNAIASAADNPIEVTRMAASVVVTPLGNLHDNKELHLDGPRGLDVFARDGRTYAVVTSHTDGGVQFVDVTNPDDPSGAGRNGDGRGSELRWARDVAVYERSGRIYAAVVGHDDAIQILDVTNPGAGNHERGHENDNSARLLGNADGVATFNIDGTTYAISTSHTENGIQITDISDPSDPTAIVNMPDNGDRLLGEPWGVAVFERDGSTYAAVTSNEDGLQIIDISRPHLPNAVGRIGDNGDRLLEDTRGVDTFEKGGRTYAVVASWLDDGIQIVDVTDPASPTAKGNLRDTDGLLILNGAHGVDVFELGEYVFAAVATFSNDGIQIVDVTDPDRPAPAASLGDTGGSGELLLDGAVEARVFQIGGVTYAAVSPWHDDGLQIVRLALAENEPPRFASASIDERSGVLTVRFTERIDVSMTDLNRMHLSQDGDVDTVSLAGASLDSRAADSDTITIKLTEAQLLRTSPMSTPQLDIGAGAVTDLAGNAIRGMPDNPVSVEAETALLVATPVGSIKDTGALLLNGPRSVNAFTIGPETYLAVTSISNHGIQFIRVTDPTNPEGAGQVSDTKGLELRDPHDSAFFEKNGSYYVAVVAHDDGMEIIDVTSPAGATPVSRVRDDSSKRLSNPHSVDVFEKDGRIYTVSTASADRGLQIVDVTDPRNPEALGTLFDGWTLYDARDVDVFTIGNRIYAVVTAYGAGGSEGWDGIRIVDVTDPRSPAFVGALRDDGTRLLKDTRGVDTFVIGEHTYAAVTGNGNDGVEIVRVTDPANPASVGRLSDSDRDRDGGGLILNNPHGVAAFEIGIRTYVAVTAGEDGLQLIDVTKPNNPIPAAEVRDTPSLLLDNTYDVDTFVIDGTTYAAVASWSEDGIQILRLEHADTSRPAFESASLNTNTRVLTVTFDEKIDVSEVSLSRFLITDADGDPSFRLAALPLSTTDDSDTITIHLSSGQINTVGAMNSPRLTISEGGVSDLAGNEISTTNNKRITLAGDSDRPAFVSAALDENTRIISISFDEIIDVSETNTWRMNVTYAGADPARDPIRLRGASLDRTGPDTDTLSLLLAESQLRRIAAIPEPLLDIREGAVVDLSGNDVEAVSDGRIEITERLPGLIITASSNIVDGRGAERLNGPTGLEIFEKDGRTYAAIVTQSDDSLQIIDITDPDNLRATDHSGDGRNSEFNNPNDVAIVKNGNKIFAVIVSDDDAVQVLEITNPSDIRETRHLNDHTDLFLGNGYALATFDPPGGIKYAIVTSESENGVQVINVDNLSRNLGATVKLADSSDLLLDDPRSVAVFADGTNRYAVITSSTEDGIQVLEIGANRVRAAGQLTFDPRLDYDNPNSVVTFQIDGHNYAAVASSKGLRMVDLGDPSSPAFAGQWIGGSSSSSPRPYEMDVFEMEGRTFVAMGFDGTAGIRFIDVTDPYRPVSVGNLWDSTGRNLHTIYDIDVFTIGASTYAAAVSWQEDALQVVRLALEEDTKPEFASAELDENTGRLTVTFNEPVDVSRTNLWRLYISDTGMANQVRLTGAGFDGTKPDAHTLTFTLTESQRRIVVPMETPQLDIAEGAVRDRAGNNIASAADNPIKVTRMAASVVVTPVGKLHDNNKELHLDGPRGLDVFALDGKTYAVVTSHTDSGVQFVDLTNPDDPRGAGRNGDGKGSELSWARDVAVYERNNRIYAAVVGHDDAIQILDVTNPGSGDHERGHVNDNNDRLLGNAEGVAIFNRGPDVYAISTSFTEDGIQITNIGNPSSPDAVGKLRDNTTHLRLNEAWAVATFNFVGGTTPYAAVAGNEDGLEIIQLNTNSPTSVGRIIDNNDLLLEDVRGLDTYEKDGKTYVVAASWLDNGIQIFEIDAGGAPTAKGKLSDSDGGLGQSLILNGAHGVDVFEMGEYIFAAVASYSNDGIQIVDITDPDRPAPAGSLGDSGELLLDGAIEVKVFEIDGVTYAAVSAWEEDGIQIVRLALAENEPPRFASASLDERRGVLTVEFSEKVDVSMTDLGRMHLSQDGIVDAVSLAGAELDSEMADSDTMTITLTESHLLRTSPMNTPQLDIGAGAVTDLAGNTIGRSTDNPAGITAESPLLFATPVANIRDDYTLLLNGPRSVNAFVIGDKTYVAVTSISNHGLELIEVTDPKNPTGVGRVKDTSGLELRDPHDTAIFKIGTKTYAAVVAHDDGMEIIDITDPANPDPVARVRDDGNKRLGNPHNVDVFEKDGKIYTVSTSSAEDGIQIVEVTDPRNPVAHGFLRHYPTLNDARDISVFTIEDRIYAVVTGYGADGWDGIRTIEVTDPRNPVFRGELEDDNNRRLDNTRGVDTFVIGERTYAAVTGNGDNGLEIVRLHGDGTVTSISSRLSDDDRDRDGNGLILNRPHGVAAFEIGIYTYVAVTAGEDGLQVVDVSDPRNLIPVVEMRDNGNRLLADTYDVDTFVIDGTTYAAVASWTEDGIQIVKLEHADTSRPVLESATLDFNTRVFSATFDKTIDASETDLSKLSIVEGSNRVSLAGADHTGMDSDAVTLTLTREQAHQVDAMASPSIDVDEGAFSDLSGNSIRSVSETLETAGRPEPAPPVAPDTDATTTEDTAIVITPAISDPDPGDTPRITDVGTPVEGSATFSDTDITYTPSPDYNGTDTFDYTVTSGADTAQGTITVTITRDNNAPVLGAIDNQTATVGIQLIITPDVTDADPTDTHTYSISRGTLPAAATFSTSDGRLDWTPVQADAGQTHEVTITVNDTRGGADSETFHITAVEAPDVTPPVITITGGSPLVHELGDPYTDQGATSDDGSVVHTTGSNVNVTKSGDYFVSYAATDDNANTGTATRTVQVRDTTAPVIVVTGPPSLTLVIDGSYTERGATVSDNDPAYTTTTATVGGATVDTNSTGTYVVSYTAPADDAGNTPDPVTRTVIVQDTAAPTITVSGDNPLAHELGNPYTDPGATSDDGSAVITDFSAVDVNEHGDYAVTYTATDAGNNTGTAIRMVQVRDTTAPVITLSGSASVTVELGGAYAELGATVSDNDDDYTTTTATVGGATVDTNSTGTYVVSYTAPADDAGNTPDPVTRTVIVQDTAAPTITVSGDNPLAHELGNPYTDPGATSDDGSAVITDSSAVDVNEHGDYTVTYTATDGDGNEGKNTRTVQVRDTTKPVIGATGDDPLVHELGDTYTDPGATVSDNDPDYTGTVTVGGDTVDADSAGTYTVSYTAPADDAGKAPDPVTRTVTVQDTTAPVITLNGDASVTVEFGGTYAEQGATVSDNDPNYNGIVTESGTVNTQVSGDYQVTYTAPADDAGNAPDTVTRFVFVRDSTAPVITLYGNATVTVELGGTYTELGAEVADSEPGYAGTVTVGGDTVDTNTAGTYTVSYTAPPDGDGNLPSPVTRTVTVQDTTAPVISLNGGAVVTVEIGDAYTEPGATVSDNDPAYTTTVATVGGDTVDTSSIGTYLVSYTAPTDDANNTPDPVTRTVVVQDTSGPAVTLNGDATVFVELGDNYVELGATAEGGLPVITDSEVDVTKAGTYTVTYTATDGDGNDGMATRIVTVRDTTPPVITVSGDDPVSIDLGSVYKDEGATSTDNDPGYVGSVSDDAAAIDTDRPGTYTVTYTTTDDAGNTATATRTVLVALDVVKIGTIIHSGEDAGDQLGQQQALAAVANNMQVLAEATGDQLASQYILAVETAVSDFNAYLTRNEATWRIAVDIKDTEEYGVQAAIQSFKADDVSLVSGSIRGPDLESIVPYVDSNDMIFFSCCSTAPSLAIAGDNMFRLAPDSLQYGPVIADLLKNEYGRNVTVMVWRDDIWGIGLKDSVADNFEELGGAVDDTVGSYDPNAADLDAVFETLAGRLADTVSDHVGDVGADRVAVLFIGQDEMSRFVSKAADHPVLRTVQWVGSDVSVLDDALVGDPRVFEFLRDANFVAPIFAEDSGSDPHRKLTRLIEAEFGTTPTAYTYGMYDSIWILGLALERAGSDAEFAAIKDTIAEAASQHDGALGNIHLNEAGDLDWLTYAVWGMDRSGWTLVGTWIDGEFKRPSGGGNDDEWQTAPTFGVSPQTGSQMVSCGYSMDGTCRDVLDYHVDYRRESIQTNSTHDFTLKAHSVTGVQQFQMGFGVPEVGSSIGQSEAVLTVDLERDYATNSTYKIRDATYTDPNDILGEATLDVALVGCMSPDDPTKCVELSVDGLLFREQMYHEPFVIYVMDVQRWSAQNYMNDGLLVQGDSLNPAPRETAGISKKGNQYDAVAISLQRTDKLSDTWEDQWGGEWTRNSYGTWSRLVPEPFERHQDGTWGVMTRMNSNFAALVQAEQDRAVLVFDAAQLMSELEPVLAYDLPEDLDGGDARLDRLEEAILAEQKRMQEIMRGLSFGPIYTESD